MLKKNSLIIRELSKEFMGLKVGDRLLTVKDYSVKFNVSVGTISKGIKAIEETNAATFQKKGHQGSYIESLDYNRLWELTCQKNIICVMPLPYLKRYEGLASGIKKAFDDKLFFAYMRGASTRISFLEEGSYHCAILSKQAAENYIKEDKKIEIALSFGKKSYMNKHVIVYGKEKIEKVGIDTSSRDHVLLTESNFDKKNHTFIAKTYSELLNSIKLGEIDAAIWNLDNIEEIKSELSYKELRDTELVENISEAVLVVKSDEKWLKNYFKKIINIESVISHQEGVIKGEINPSY